MAAYDDLCCETDVRAGKRSDPKEVLATLDSFPDHLREGFPADAIDVEIETEAHSLLIDPPALKEKIVSRFRTMGMTIAGLGVRLPHFVGLRNNMIAAFSMVTMVEFAD